MPKLKIAVALGFAATFTAGIALATPRRRVTSPSCRGAARIRMPRRRSISSRSRRRAGVAMNDKSWDGGIGVLRAKVQGGAATWDVVQVESDELAVGCEEGLFEKIDYAKIGGEAAYLPPSVNSCGVGAIVYDFVLGYDKDKLKDAPKGWADFFDTKKYPGQARAASGPEDHAGDRADGRRRRAEGRLQGAGHRRGRRARLQEAGHASRATSSGGRPAPSRRNCSPPAKWR